jgi:FtsP/CotA-like multicopper oxidase with cupredoxin domain
VSEDNQLIYELNDVEKMIGWQGDTILVNGTHEPSLQVERTRYRFRLLNGANARVFLLGFEDGRPFHLIANDGGLLSAPVEVESIYLAPGERGEILVDFSNDLSGESLLLRSLEFTEEFIPRTRQGKPAELIRFEVGGAGPTPPPLPATLSTIEEYDPEEAIRTREFNLHMFGGGHAINDLLFDPERVDFTVPINELEIWHFTNGTQTIHPMHVHGLQFQVLDRNGSTNLVRPEERGWKDTVTLFPTSAVRVLIRFTAHAGMFMLHCHNLEHEDDGMMMNFMVDPNTGVRNVNRQAGPLRATPNTTRGPVELTFTPSSRDRLLEVSDLTGQMVMRHPIPSGSDRMMINLSSEPSGMYVVRVGMESVRVMRGG